MAPHAITDDETQSLNSTAHDTTNDGEGGNRSLPVQSPCLSYWHRTTRAFRHLHANYDQPVPESSEYCIVGSGLSGALTAWELVESGVKGSDILIVEAREAVSGASGRNAGHVRPGSSPSPADLHTIAHQSVQMHFAGTLRMPRSTAQTRRRRSSRMRSLSLNELLRSWRNTTCNATSTRPRRLTSA